MNSGGASDVSALASGLGATKRGRDKLRGLCRRVSTGGVVRRVRGRGVAWAADVGRRCGGVPVEQCAEPRGGGEDGGPFVAVGVSEPACAFCGDEEPLAGLLIGGPGGRCGPLEPSVGGENIFRRFVRSRPLLFRHSVVLAAEEEGFWIDAWLGEFFLAEREGDRFRRRGGRGGAL